VFLVTDKGCFLLDAANFKLKERFAFSEIQQIAVSSRTDGIVVLRLPVDGPNARGDLVLDMSEKVIEFVLKLALNAEKLGDVEIDPSNTILHNLPGGKSGQIVFSQGEIAFAGKGKTGNLEIVTPTA
jgi:hypothetical protein